MSAAIKLINDYTSSAFPNVDEVYEAQIIGTSVVNTPEKTYHFLDLSTKDSKGKQAIFSMFVKREVDKEAIDEVSDEIFQIETFETEGKKYPKMEFEIIEPK
jgi:hypothetical protein